MELVIMVRMGLQHYVYHPIQLLKEDRSTIQNNGLIAGGGGGGGGGAHAEQNDWGDTNDADGASGGGGAGLPAGWQRGGNDPNSSEKVKMVILLKVEQVGKERMMPKQKVEMVEKVEIMEVYNCWEYLMDKMEQMEMEEKTKREVVMESVVKVD